MQIPDTLNLKLFHGMSTGTLSVKNYDILFDGTRKTFQKQMTFKFLNKLAKRDSLNSECVSN